MLRARFDEHKNEKDMVKATRMLKAAEEEFWATQHPQPYLFPDSPGGTSYERQECYKVESGPECGTGTRERVWVGGVTREALANRGCLRVCMGKPSDSTLFGV